MRVPRANVAFWVLWTGAAFWCYLNAYDDPSSVFYDDRRAFGLGYSSVRMGEVNDFLAHETTWTAAAANASSASGEQRAPLLCIGIRSVNRATELFLQHAVGSLVDTLDAEERQLVRVVVLLANQEAESHVAYGQEWLSRVADEVLVYEAGGRGASRSRRSNGDNGEDEQGEEQGEEQGDAVKADDPRTVQEQHNSGEQERELQQERQGSGEQSDRGTQRERQEHPDNATPSPSQQQQQQHQQQLGYIRVPWHVRGDGLVRGTDRVQNMRLDHSVLLQHCQDGAAPYLALIEDDIIAARDWLARTLVAIRHMDSSGGDWLYLRLFYSELLMGWNSEEWPRYAAAVSAAYALVVLMVLAEHRRRRRRYMSLSSSDAAPAPAMLAKSVPSRARHPLNHLTALVLGLWTPAVIALCFMAGRVSLHRLSPFSPPAGVRLMPDYGCCAQGLVFPRRHVQALETLLQRPPFDFAGDQIFEAYARSNALDKWALDPAVLQHLGRRQSSEGVRKAEVWNFSFERQRGP